VKVAPDLAEVVATEDEPYSVRLASKYASAVAARQLDERRQYSRRRDRDLDWIHNVRLKSIGDVSVVDLSAGGILLDAHVPLRPGSALALEIAGGGIETIVPFHVLRCHVAALMADGARYRGACEFERPIELPGTHALPDFPSAASDAFVGVDSALKRLVERAYAADTAHRLAAGDVLLVLQALARRALSVESDPLGRHVGNLLQELLPALRHGHGMPTVLAAIERQLCHTLPNTRVRMTDEAPAPEGAKSVLICLPGTDQSAGSVRIDVPLGTPVNDAQARLLRTSGRLIALVQRLNGHASGTHAPERVETLRHRPARSIVPADSVSRIAEPDPSDHSWNRVVVRYTDGQLLKGFTRDFHGSRHHFTLCPSIDATAYERIFVPLARLKAVFFVRAFDGNPDYVEQKTFDSRTRGRRIEVTLLDGEVLVGTTLNYRTDTPGFFINPADRHTNNMRVFVVGSAVRQVRFP
jgi:uncharacterized protein DUF6982